MSSLFSSVSSNSGLFIIILSVLVLILAGLQVKNMMTIRSLHHRFALLLADTEPSSLESMLHEHLEGRRLLASQAESMEQRVNVLERKMQRSKRHLGLVRYDAFPDIGGQQSFAMALYDDNGDGAVLTSIIGRADGRVYGKTIAKGKAERELGEEEQNAILEAVKQYSGNAVI
jgi:hypothetical protein